MSKMTAAQRAALARLRVNHPRATVSVLWEPRDKHPRKVKVRMGWSARSRIVWLDQDGRMELGETHGIGRDRQAVPARASTP